MRFLRTFLGYTALASFSLLAVMSVLSSASLLWAQSDRESIPQIITQDIALSWPLVLLVIVSAAGYATSVAQARAHQTNPDIHHTLGELKGEFANQTMCTRIHAELNGSIRDMLNMLEEMNRTLGKLEGKLEK